MKLNIFLMVLSGLIVGVVLSSPGNRIPDSCMRLYNEGGAPAVLWSHECAFGVLPPQDHNWTTNCQFAILQGRREYQEDRISCDLDMHIDVYGNCGPERLKLSMVAVFDGHGGDEASDMAARLLPNYFQLHLKFIGYKEMGLYYEDHDLCLPEMGTYPSDIFPGRNIRKERMMEIIKEALLRTVHDIDHTFSQVALRNSIQAGSTASIVLIVNGHILSANVGDSKALLISEKLLSSNHSNKAGLSAVVLTEEHNPDKDEEKARIEAAGGFVSVRGVPRVNGILAVSRAIGDVYLKRYGLISDPEVKGWLPLQITDKFLVVASDGIFESLKPQDVCDLLLDACSQNELISQASANVFSRLADYIVTMAYEKGSTDNLSAVVVPLRGMILQDL